MISRTSKAWSAIIAGIAFALLGTTTVHAYEPTVQQESVPYASSQMPSSFAQAMGYWEDRYENYFHSEDSCEDWKSHVLYPYSDLHKNGARDAYCFKDAGDSKWSMSIYWVL